MLLFLDTEFTCLPNQGNVAAADLDRPRLQGWQA